MNFNIVDLIARIEQLEANTINNTAVYELNKSIDKVTGRLDSIDLMLGSTIDYDMLNNAIAEVKASIADTSRAIEMVSNKQAEDKKELVNSSVELAKTIKQPIEPKCYDNEIALIKSSILKAKSDFALSIEGMESKIKPPIEPLNYDSKIDELKHQLSEALAPIKDIEAKIESSRRTYGEELSSFTLKTNKKLDAINEKLGAHNGE